MVREGRRVCEEWRVVLGVGVRLHKGNPGVWKRGGDGGRTKESNIP